MITKFAASVILYQPDKSCIDNIRTYLPFVEKLYAIDNSESPSDVAAEIKSIDKISYLSIGKNIGIAAALNLACRKAKEDGFGWILTMDQDSVFDNDLFFRAIQTISSTDDVAIISPNHDRKISESENFISSQKDMILTSGNLLNLKLYDKIGRFNDALFIDEVDHDYCLRARVNNYKIICFDSIVLNHKIGQAIQKRGRTISVHAPIRYYYMTRNCFYLLNKYQTNFPEPIWKRKLYLYRELMNVLRFHENKLEKMKHAFSGFLDYRKNKYGTFKNNSIKVRKYSFPLHSFVLFMILFFALLFNAEPRTNP